MLIVPACRHRGWEASFSLQGVCKVLELRSHWVGYSALDAVPLGEKLSEMKHVGSLGSFLGVTGSRRHVWFGN